MELVRDNLTPDWMTKNKTFTGTVLAVQANYYSVCLDASSSNSQALPRLLCTRRARLRKLGQKVMVGDRVLVEEPDWTGMRGVIVDILPRQSQFDRPPIANVDQVLLMFAVAEPDLDSFQLTQFLIRVELEGLEICLCLNKTDLITTQSQQEWQHRLQLWGYQPIFLSLHTNTGMDALYERLHKKITIVSGPSGVGKSSLINRLVPTTSQSVSSVSGKLARGRHTTRHVELFTLPNSGVLADSPGFNRPEINCLPDELASLFPEARQRLSNATCQFHNCLHHDEPNCVVRGDWDRYSHYLTLLNDAIARHTRLKQQSNPETSTKLKTKRGGERHHEPKLAAKKYRRTSRNVAQQNLQRFYQDLDS